MIANTAKCALPLVALVMGAGLSGCSYSVEWGDVDGVAFSEFDQSGDAPDEVSLSGSDSVIITEGDTFSMTVEGDEDAQEALRFDRSGNELRIARDQSVYNGNSKAIVRITMPAPSGLSVSGSSDMESATMASDADIDLSGASSLTVTNLDADVLDLDLSGASQLTAAGTVERLVVDVSGAGSARMGDVLADDVKVDLSGASSVSLASNGVVDADLSGASRLTVTGSATCNVDSSGASSFTCRQAETAAEATAEDE